MTRRNRELTQENTNFLCGKILQYMYITKEGSLNSSKIISEIRKTLRELNLLSQDNVIAINQACHHTHYRDYFRQIFNPLYLLLIVRIMRRENLITQENLNVIFESRDLLTLLQGVIALRYKQNINRLTQGNFVWLSQLASNMSASQENTPGCLTLNLEPFNAIDELEEPVYARIRSSNTILSLASTPPLLTYDPDFQTYDPDFEFERTLGYLSNNNMLTSMSFAFAAMVFCYDLIGQQTGIAYKCNLHYAMWHDIWRDIINLIKTSNLLTHKSFFILASLPHAMTAQTLEKLDENDQLTFSNLSILADIEAFEDVNKVANALTILAPYQLTTKEKIQVLYDRNSENFDPLQNAQAFVNTYPLNKFRAMTFTQLNKLAKEQNQGKSNLFFNKVLPTRPLTLITSFLLGLESNLPKECKEVQVTQDLEEKQVTISSFKLKTHHLLQINQEMHQSMLNQYQVEPITASQEMWDARNERSLERHRSAPCCTIG